MLTDRDRFLATVRGDPVERPPFYLAWGPWGTTWQRWKREGMPAELKDFAAVRAFFGADQGPRALPINCGPFPAFPREVLAEDESSRTYRDSWGIIRRGLKTGESMDDFLEFPIKDRADWERYKTERLDPAHPDRLSGPWRQRGAEWLSAGIPVQLGYFPDSGLFGGLRWLFGDEACLYLFHDDPGLVHEVMEHLTSLFLAVFEQVVAAVRVDVIHLWEDMCGRNGPLIGPTMWREFLGPRYRRIRAFADRHGIPVVSVDTDGNPDLIITPMLEAGINLLYPFEVAAGCDVNDLRRRYPGLGMMGGIDKRVLAQDAEAVDREIRRVLPAVRSGRYIPTTDHCIPSDVSWRMFAYYARRMRATLHGLSPADYRETAS